MRNARSAPEDVVALQMTETIDKIVVVNVEITIDETADLIEGSDGKRRTAPPQIDPTAKTED